MKKGKRIKKKKRIKKENKKREQKREQKKLERRSPPKIFREIEIILNNT